MTAQEQIKTLVNEWEKGTSKIEIAKILGITMQQLNNKVNTLRKHGVQIKKRTASRTGLHEVLIGMKLIDQKTPKPVYEKKEPKPKKA